MKLLSILPTLALMAMATAPAHAQFSKPRRQYVEHIVVASHPDRTYATGEQATLRVEAYRGGLPVDSVTLYYKVGDDMFLPSAEDSTTFAQGVATIDMGTRSTPGFRACNLRFTVDGRTVSDAAKVAFSPEAITSATPNPSDFDAFWEDALASAASVELSPKITPLPHRSTDSVAVSLVEINVGPNGRNMYGYLTQPRREGRFPVLFCPPGAGASKIEPTTYYSEQGYIYLNICIHSGCNPELPDSLYAEARRVAEDYLHNGISDKQTFYLRDVYAGCSRCVDFLCTLPSWDGVNVGVTGGSQGGALTIVTAALNPKVTFCAPFYPALADLLAYRDGRAGGYPGYFRKGDEPAGTASTLPYYDVVNFARRLQCPVFFSYGYNDDTCPPTSTTAAYNAITAPKTLRTTPSSGHWRFRETNDECMEWMKAQLRPAIQHEQ